MSLLGAKGEETYEEKKARFRKKMAMMLTPDQNKRANKSGLIIYLLTYLYVICNCILHGEIKIVPFVIMAVMAVVQIVLFAKKGKEDDTATIMAVSFVITYFVNVIMLETEFYPMIFIVVYALVIFSDVLLCKCGGIATLVGIIIRAVVLFMRGAAITTILPMVVLGIIFAWAVIVTAKAIYTSSFENMETIEEATKEAVEVANKIEIISNEIIDNFSEISGGMKVITEKAGENKEALDDITNASLNNSEQMNHQTDMTQNIYAVVEETQANAAHVQENALTVLETVEQGAELSKEMITHTQAVTNGINETQDVVKELVEHVGEVSGITDSILAISSQTNLLALNASIEAARAGEAGKGFAVVADEIRNLAEQTKNSTEEISNIMNTLVTYATTSVKTLDKCVEDVENQTTVIKQVGDSFNSTVDDVANLKMLVDGIIASIEEISKHTATIVDSVSNVNENTQKVSELSGNGAEGAGVIYDIIQNFADTIGVLNKRVNELQEVTRK